MSKIIPKKPALVYNSIEHQSKTAANSLTIGEWNRVINKLKQQANLNTKYLENLHRLLFYDWDSDDSGYAVGGILPVFYEDPEDADLQGQIDNIVSESAHMINDVKYNSVNGVLTFTKYDDTTKEIDLRQAIVKVNQTSLTEVDLIYFMQTLEEGMYRIKTDLWGHEFLFISDMNLPVDPDVEEPVLELKKEYARYTSNGTSYRYDFELNDWVLSAGGGAGGGGGVNIQTSNIQPTDQSVGDFWYDTRGGGEVDEDYAFYDWILVPYIEIQAITPPTLVGGNDFLNQNVVPIYVPDESVDDYKTATNWVDLADRIFPISDMTGGEGNSYEPDGVTIVLNEEGKLKVNLKYIMDGGYL